MIAPIDWLDQTVEFHDVPAASHAYFVENGERVGGWYHSNVFYVSDVIHTFDTMDTPVGKVPVVKMYLDRSCPPFRSRTEKDSTLQSQVFGWEIGALYPFAELGALYYHDALLKYMPTWQTFQDADSLAYDAMCTAYHHDPQEFGYLYYPITHLTTLNWRLKKDTSILKPFLDSTFYIPMPEELLEEHRYDRVDLLTPFFEAKQENDYHRNVLSSMQEPSLLVSRRQGPVVRWHCVSHHGGTLYSTRIEDDTIYDKELFNTFDFTDPFDTTIDQDPEHYADTLIVRKRPLTTAARDTLISLLKAIDHEDYNGMLGQRLGISPTLYHFEYILNGRYHHFSAIHNFDDSPSEPSPPVKALMDWFSALKQKE